MSVSNATSRISFAGDAATLTFSTTPVKFFTSADIDVLSVSSTGTTTTLALTTHYTVTGGSGGTNSAAIGTIALTAATIAVGSTLVIARVLDVVQNTDLVNNDSSDADVVEAAFDRLTMIAQQHATDISRSLVADNGYTGTMAFTLPADLLTTAGAIVMVNTLATGFAIGPTASQVSTAATNAAAASVQATAAAAQAAAATVQVTAAAVQAAAASVQATAAAASATTAGAASRVRTNESRSTANVGLTTTLAANALTLALTQADGTTPAAAGPVEVAFRSSTIGSGVFNARAVTIATTLAIPSGTSIGTASGVAARIWVAAIDNAGTVELAVLLAKTATGYTAIQEENVITTTAIAAGATAGVWYSTTARSSVPVTVLGYFEATQATAGTWLTAPSLIVVNPRKRPGDIIQSSFLMVSASATGTTTMPLDNTTPLAGEGDQYMIMTAAITSAINRLDIDVQFHGGSTTTATNALLVALFQDALTNAITAAAQICEAGSGTGPMNPIRIRHRMTAGATSVIFKVRAGSSAAGTTTFNGGGGAGLFGGTMYSHIQVDEVMM